MSVTASLNVSTEIEGNEAEYSAGGRKKLVISIRFVVNAAHSSSEGLLPRYTRRTVKQILPVSS